MTKHWGCKLGSILLALSLLSGCSAMLSRSYSSITPHNATPTALDDANTLRVDSYQELVNALIYLIDKGAETGIIRFDRTTESEAKSMLSDACLEVVKEDPLGAYAVEFIKYSLTPIVANYEADVQITYRRTREQVAAVVDATGTSAIRSELQETLSTFSSEVAMRISYFEGDSVSIQTLVRQAYFANPDCALGLPDAAVSMYPETGQRRIVEVQLTYPYSFQTLEERRTALNKKAAQLTLPIQEKTPEKQISSIVETILSTCQTQTQDASTAYDVLFEGEGNDQGLSLTFSLLCKQIGLECLIVDGWFNETPHIWNIVKTSQGYRHIDLTAEKPTLLFLDVDAETTGYQWDKELSPSCIAS